MSSRSDANAAAEKAVGGVMFCVGLVSLGVFAWATRRVMLLDRALDFGDVVVLSVFAVFGLFCLRMGWRLFWKARRQASTAAQSPASDGSSAEQAADASPPRRVTVSHGFAAAGVVLLILSVLVPAGWYPVVLFFLGLACLAVSHGLTPCVERIEQLRKARDSVRQL